MLLKPKNTTKNRDWLIVSMSQVIPIWLGLFHLNLFHPWGKNQWYSSNDFTEDFDVEENFDSS